MLLNLERLMLTEHKYPKYIVESRVIKIVSIINFILLLSILMIIKKTPSASFYEISIYNVYPCYFWFLVITIILIGEIILLKSSISLEKNSNFWIVGFISILLMNIILLLMPFIRGYYAYGRGDVLTHIGYVNDICKTASIGANNFYPIDHILTASLCFITNIKVEKAVNLIPPFFSIFYICSIYILSSSIFEEKSEILFTLGVSSILLFDGNNLIFAPHVQSFLLFPFILYLFFKSRNYKKPVEFSILLIIMLFFLVFFHPMTTIFLIITLLIMELFKVFTKKIYKERFVEWFNFGERETSSVLVITFITLFSWYFSFYLIRKCFSAIIDWLLFEIGNPEAEIYTGLISRTTPSVLDVIEVVLNKYGQIIVLGILFTIFSLYFMNVWKKDKENQKSKMYHKFYCFISLIFITISIIVFFNSFIIEFGRASQYYVFFTSVFVAISYSKIYSLLRESKSSSKNKKIIFMSLCVAFILLVYFSTFNLYLSPRIKSANEQVAEDEVKGMTFFYSHRNQDILIQELGISQDRFHSLIFGVSVPPKKIRYGFDTLPVDHFNYTDNVNYGNSYDNPQYLIISSLGRNIYPELYPGYEKYWRFIPEDFDKLEKDTSVLSIYNSPTLNIYLVKKIE